MQPRDLLPPPSRARRGNRRKVALVVLGVGLIVVGVVGGILPIVPGTPLVLLGIGMMATHSPRGRWLRWRVGGFLRARGLERLARPLRGFSALSAPARRRSPADVRPDPGASARRAPSG